MLPMQTTHRLSLPLCASTNRKQNAFRKRTWYSNQLLACGVDYVENDSAACIYYVLWRVMSASDHNPLAAWRVWRPLELVGSDCAEYISGTPGACDIKVPLGH